VLDCAQQHRVVAGVGGVDMLLKHFSQCGTAQRKTQYTVQSNDVREARIGTLMQVNMPLNTLGTQRDELQRLLPINMYLPAAQPLIDGARVCVSNGECKLVHFHQTFNNYAGLLPTSDYTTRSLRVAAVCTVNVCMFASVPYGASKMTIGKRKRCVRLHNSHIVCRFADIS
jgi:hypothetical protein